MPRVQAQQRKLRVVLAALQPGGDVAVPEPVDVARSLSRLSLPCSVAYRSWPLEAKVAMARTPRGSDLTSSLSVEAKNQIGLGSFSNCAVIGLA